MWQTALSLMTGAAAALSPLLGWTRPRSIDGRVLSLAEVKAIREQGFEIVFCQTPASGKCQQYIFRACLNGRTVGQLDIDFIGARRWLYVANVYVVETQGNRGVGTAILVGAAKTTDCRVLTTSTRTRQGARFFAKNRPVLKRYGIEMRDRPPALPAPVPSIPQRASAFPAAAG